MSKHQKVAQLVKQAYENSSEEKLERDFNSKIFFDEVKEEVRYRYKALKEVFE